MNDDNDVNKETPSEKPPTQKPPSLLRNYVSFAGFAIVAASLTSIVLLILIEVTGSAGDNPYSDLITFILFPSILLFGLFIVLVGALIERRRRRTRSAAEIAAYPILDLNDPRRRRAFLVFLSLSFAFLFMSAFGGYRAYEYTESVTFCGQACHTVMRPEFIAYNASPHARVRCVECHVGGGPDAYVRAKFSGMRQLYGVVSGDFSRPIHTPVANMRPANETCAKCHWPEKFHGEKLKVFNHFGFDEKNSLSQTKLLVNVGGGSASGGAVGGIHWHMNVANEITYVATDDKRQDIPWVRMKSADGSVVEYTVKNSGLSAPQIENAPKRVMNCIDCHNRPTHIFLSPNNAVDQSLMAGILNVELPFIKSKAVETLSRQYATTEEAVASIKSDLDGYYRTTYPALYSEKRGSIDAAVTEVQRLYQTYFFPEMKTDWQSHSNNIGHFNTEGCFRCHDGQHFSPEGKVIRNECNVCHVTVGQTFLGKPVEIKDGKFQHPLNLGDRGTWQCAACHKGDRSFKHPLNLGDISKFQCADCHTGSYEKVKY
ncbi:MAG: NapC/NirT family cytochrome c [Pyrinomonadaceae bacterium]